MRLSLNFNYICTLLSLGWFILNLIVYPVGCSSAMKRLYEDLFTDYNRGILPVADNKTKVTVTLGLKLGQILDLNLKQQILSTNVWVEQTWHDYRLEWRPESYEGIDMIHVPAENIWIPDIVLFNNADGNYELTLVAKARLYYNGTVVWKPPTMFRSTCEIDVEYFPFDIQTCYLRFASWTYAGDEVELQQVGNKRKMDIGIDLSQFYKNVEWDIIDVPAYYNEVYYDGYTEPYPDITFKIVIRRKMLFYLVNLILPVALMTFMTVSVFYLPADSNEKVTLSISILTSLIVFFLLMLEIIPASSLAVPLFGKYLLFTLVLISLSACVSVYVLNIHHRSPAIHTMSPRVRQIFLKTLPRLLRLNRPDPRERSSLNRFRKKKIAQQLRKASSINKVYDLAQPLATSLNLIESLHKGYDFNPNDDDPNGFAKEDDEGRYFRRYVDNYIERMQKAQELEPKGCNCAANQQPLSSSCCRHNGNCCSRASQPLQTLHKQRRPITSCSANWNESSADPLCPLVSTTMDDGSSYSKCQHATKSYLPNCLGGCLHHNNKSHLGMLNDDTLDITFDYDDQDNNNNNNNNGFLAPNSAARCAPKVASPLLNDDLPSPPPPPRQLSQLSDSLHNKSGRLSNCSTNAANNKLNLQPASSDESQEDHGQLVDKLINSINLINNVSDDIDTSTTPSNSNNEEEHELAFAQANNMYSQSKRVYNHQSSASTGQRCKCELRQRATGGFAKNSNHNTNYGLQSKPLAEQPSDLLMSLRFSYDQMPAHVRAAIRSILFIADTIKNEDDENSAIEDWESMSMVVDRLFLWIFFLLCTFGSIIILALAPSLYDQRASIDDKLGIDIPLSNCSASVYGMRSQ